MISPKESIPIIRDKYNNLYMFKKVDPKQSFPKMEEEILKFWEANKIFEKSVEKNPEDKPFIFYEGPPTANGMPGLHHILARAFKDIIPRYKTMKGYRVERKAGWDTHGLPVEIQVEKSLGLRSKQEIENIVPGNPRESVIVFNKKCKESVWLYKDAWEKMTRRMAYWVDMKNPYITYENKYIESVWWVVAQIFKSKNKKGENLVYKGHKVVPYCYRCGTALSSHEVAQGYQKIKDNSVYVKFKAKPNQKIGDFTTDDKTYFLVWTTTPWTLPGNVALAVNKDIDYVFLKRTGNRMTGKHTSEGDVQEESDITPGMYILAKDIFWNNMNSAASLQEVRFLIDGYSGEKTKDLFLGADEFIKKYNIKVVKGENLLGLEYEPLYVVENKENKKAHYVIAGEFVTTQDGTGIVHVAPAFGEDDAQVGRENNLPTLLTVDQEGKINADVPGKGMLVKKKDSKGKYAVDELIIEDLKKRELFFKKELYEHDYPFCWRCDTPLIYYAKPSWFIRMNELVKDLVKNNENINWIPENIKEGRFGEWLRGVKDWAISRERYWGTPLPIWECAKCGETKVVESIDEIREQLGNPNKLFLVRHGEAENNVKNILNSDLSKNHYHLTNTGKEQIKNLAKILKKEKIDVIFSSPFLRTMETAEIIAKEIGIEVIFDERIRELEIGKFNGKTIEEFDAVFQNWPEKSEVKREDFGIESEDIVKNRLNNFLKEINEKYSNKNIVIVSHGDPIQFFYNLIQGEDRVKAYNNWYPEKGSVKTIYSKPFDLHKPFIDDVKLKCACGAEMKRVSEVLDVWFDSGSMPLAQFFYPNGASQEDKEKIGSGKYFPADYISEAIDQTRGWFYTLHAIATLLHKDKKLPVGYAFKNVICLAHILDRDGKKMSKSRGNVVEPMEVMDKFGADMLRWMLFTINQPGIPKRFDIKGMQDIMNRVFRMLWNSYSFFVMYANIDKFKVINYKLQATGLLDKWVLSELNILIKKVDVGLKNYDVYGSAKEIEKFIDNLSNWYIRRSRKRFWKSEDDADKKEAYQTLHYVLVTLSKLMAPFTPFIAEEIYRNLMNPHPSPLPEGEGDLVSVHLEDYPEADEKLIDEILNQEMQEVRAIITEALQLRAKAGIKVRQPIASLKIKRQKAKVKKELIEIIKDEVNVKEVIFDDLLIEDIAIDTNISEELKLEGQAREIIRFIQEMRKEAGYEVDNRIKVWYSGLSEVFAKFGGIIKKEVLAEELKGEKTENFDLEKKFKIENEDLKIYIKR